MIFVQNVCAFGTILKLNYCSFCCFLNHTICFCKSRVFNVLCGQKPRQNPGLCHFFLFINEIIMEVSTTKTLICEDNDETNY